MKKLLYLFVCSTIIFLSMAYASCSVVQRSAFSVDTVSAKNLHIQKTDSIQFKPFK